MKIGLVACGASKRGYPCIARSLYTGDLFKKASQYAATHNDQWFILSARYGLVHPDSRIEPYNKTLVNAPQADVQAWLGKVLTQLAAANLMDETFEMHAGKAYSKPLLPHIQFTDPLMGLKIGQRLAWYSRALRPAVVGLLG